MSTNRENIAQLERTLATRVEQKRDCNTAFKVTPQEVVKYKEFCSNYLQQASAFYEKLGKALTPELRAELTDLYGQLSDMSTILCYTPDSPEKEQMMHAAHQVTGHGIHDSEENRVRDLICQLSAHFQ